MKVKERVFYQGKRIHMQLDIVAHSDNDQQKAIAI